MSFFTEEEGIVGDMKFRFGLIKRSNGDPVPEDEPVFILRARDHLAVPLLMAYASLSKRDGCNDYHEDGLQAVLARFVEFAKDHPERMKQPGVTRGV